MPQPVYQSPSSINDQVFRVGQIITRSEDKVVHLLKRNGLRPASDLTAQSQVGYMILSKLALQSEVAIDEDPWRCVASWFARNFISLDGIPFGKALFFAGVKEPRVEEMLQAGPSSAWERVNRLLACTSNKSFTVHACDPVLLIHPHLSPQDRRSVRTRIASEYQAAFIRAHTESKASPATSTAPVATATA
jgi:hypothetical protein